MIGPDAVAKCYLRVKVIRLRAHSYNMGVQRQHKINVKL